MPEQAEREQWYYAVRGLLGWAQNRGWRTDVTEDIRAIAAVYYERGRAEGEGALRDALDLAVKWRDVTEDVAGRLTSGGSAELDFMGDEMDRLRALLPSEGAES